MSRLLGQTKNIGQDALVGDHVALPSDGIAGARPSKLTEIDGTVRGLMAVGASLGEALVSIKGKLKPEEIIAVAERCERDGLKRMHGLYAVQKLIRDKEAFAYACLEAGFHPAGVAMAAVALDADGLVIEKSTEAARKLIVSFGVDTWMANMLYDSLIVMTSRRDAIISAPLYAPCTVMIHHESAKNFDMPNLMAVGGTLNVAKVRGLTLSGLTRVGGDLNATNGEDLVFPKLKEIGGSLSGPHSNRLEFYELESIEDQLILIAANYIRMDKLRIVGGVRGVAGSKGLYAPELVGDL